MAQTLFVVSGGNFVVAVCPTGGPPATPAIVIVDDADGDSVTVTITNTDATAINTVSIASITDGLFDVATKEGGGLAQRTGDGVIVVAVVPGFYFGKVDTASSKGSAVSNVVQFRATSGVAPIWIRLMDAVAAVVNAAALTTAGGDPITAVVNFAPVFEDVDTAQVFVFPNTDELEGQMSAANKGTYNVSVVLAQQADTDEEQDNKFQIRQDIARLFVGKRLAAEPDFDPPNQSSDPVISDREALAESGLFISPLGFDFVTRETRQ